MRLTYLQIYLLVVNTCSLLFFFVEFKYKLHNNDFKNEKSKLDIANIIISLLGGPIGIIVGWLIFDRHRNKTYAAFLLFSLCSLMIWLCVFFTMYGPVSEIVKENLLIFFSEKWLVLTYLVIINTSVAIIFKLDKTNSEKDGYRFSVMLILLLCFIGGAFGGLYGMYKYNHKTRKFYFRYGIPMIIVSEMIVLFFLDMAEII